jgi:hypothetical protein
MKLKHFAAALALSSLGAVSAQAATLVAGWDFSQYWAPFLSVDNATVSSELPANYSFFDPTQGLGVEAGDYGRMVLPFAAVGDGSEPFLPTEGSLDSNLDGTLAGGILNPFDSLSALSIEMPTVANALNRMAAFANVSGVVFEASLAPAGQTGANWVLTFGAQMVDGLGAASSQIAIEFSSNGVDWVTLAPVDVGLVDTAYSVSLGSAASERAFVRLGFALGASIDNVAILADVVSVPEPATASLLLAGLVGLVRFGRRRAA